MNVRKVPIDHEFVRQITLLIWWSLPVATLHGAPVDFQSQIQPIFAAHCISCHGPDEQNSSLRLDDRSSLLRGGDLGEIAIAPHKPEKSFLVRLLRGDIPDMRMPPDGDELSREQIELISRWIAEGAHWPGQMDKTADTLSSDHWSLQPLTRPKIPEPTPGQQDHNLANPIDAFVQRKLLQSDLAFSPPADAITLARRLSLVLTGLPPNQQQIRALSADKSQATIAYQRLVDQLLAS
ncbi:MAG: DUF1549 domain-containing protein, partial [Pirellulaceae bacterium]|nr:DUF1549 domain-containing protein [Pirellulaceae bacterium]